MPESKRPTYEELMAIPAVRNVSRWKEPPPEPQCRCPRECHCERDSAGEITGILGDCPLHGDPEVDPALCPAKKHWWE